MSKESINEHIPITEEVKSSLTYYVHTGDIVELQKAYNQLNRLRQIIGEEIKEIKS